jgi:hypothetical protein
MQVWHSRAHTVFCSATHLLAAGRQLSIDIKVHRLDLQLVHCSVCLKAKLLACLLQVEYAAGSVDSRGHIPWQHVGAGTHAGGYGAT